MTNEYELKPYTRPTCYAGKTWEGWLVGLGRHRESALLTHVNFEVFWEQVLQASDSEISILEPNMGWDGTAMEISPVYLVRESHCLVGWVEWIAIHPSDTSAVAKAQELMELLNQYPVLDEDRWSEREMLSIEEYWINCSLQGRIEHCRECGESIFAARQIYPTEKVYNWLRDTWY